MCIHDLLVELRVNNLDEVLMIPQKTRVVFCVHFERVKLSKSFVLKKIKVLFSKY